MTNQTTIPNKSSEKLSVFIVEDEELSRDIYKDTLLGFDPTKQVIENICIFKNDTELIELYTEPNPNIVFIVDLVLDQQSREMGIKRGLRVLKHILRMGVNPIQVISGNTKEQSFRDILKENSKQIVCKERTGVYESTLREFFERAKNHLDSIRQISVGLAVSQCMHSKGIDLFDDKEASIDSIFEDYYGYDSNNPRNQYFLARSFALLPFNLDFQAPASIESEHLTWFLNKSQKEGWLPDLDDYFIRKHFNKKSKRLISIALHAPAFEYRFDNHNTFIKFNENIETNSPDALQRMIIDFYFIERLTDLYLFGELTKSEAYKILTGYTPYIQVEDFDLFFAVAFWEKQQQLCYNSPQRKDQLKTTDFSSRLPLVTEVIYCKVTDEDPSDADYIGIELKSLRSPGETVYAEYEKLQLSPHLLQQHRAFKAIHIVNIKNGEREGHIKHQQILLDEFNLKEL